jgi:hypothetical protein
MFQLDPIQVINTRLLTFTSSLFFIKLLTGSIFSIRFMRTRSSTRIQRVRSNLKENKVQGKLTKIDGSI